MLTKLNIMQIITIVHADSGYAVRPEKVEIWYEALQHLDLDRALMVARYARTVKFFGEPKLSDFIDCLQKCTKSKELDISPDSAFNLICEGIRRFSYHHDAELLASLPDVVAQAAKIFGISEIRMSENISICRAQFAKCFESVRVRAERDEQEKICLPPSLKFQIDNTCRNKPPVQIGPLLSDLLNGISEMSK